MPKKSALSPLLGHFYGLLVLMASLHPAANAQVELAHAGEARAVIVAEEWVPEATAAFRQLSVSTGQERDLLGETFEGTIGESIETRGWTSVEGAYVVSHDGEESGYSARARSPGSPQFEAVSDKKLSRPHTVTEDAPLTLEYVLARPADTSHESWAYAGVHTESGERWAHGIHIARGGAVSFELAAEGADPDRVPLPGEAGRVLDLRVEMRPTTVRWYWRNHGSRRAIQEMPGGEDCRPRDDYRRSHRHDESSWRQQARSGRHSGECGNGRPEEVSRRRHRGGVRDCACIGSPRGPDEDSRGRFAAPPSACARRGLGLAGNG